MKGMPVKVVLGGLSHGTGALTTQVAVPIRPRILPSGSEGSRGGETLGRLKLCMYCLGVPLLAAA